MAMLDGLRNIFIESLKFCKSKLAYDILVEKWNKECEEVYKYKQSLIEEEQAKHTPTADVVEVKHAFRTLNVGHRSYCSNCGGLAVCEKYCSLCGAKMDGGGKE